MALDIKFKEKLKLDISTKDSKSRMDMPAITNFICYLMNCEKVVKMFHWTTDSFSVHKAMDYYLKSSGDLIDSIAEQSMGCSGQRLKGFTDYKLSEYEGISPLEYFSDVVDYIEEYRYELYSKENTAIQSVIDELVALVKTTKYKLSLK